VSDIGQNRRVRKEVGHFERKFQEEWGWGRPTTVESLGYHVALFA